MKYIITENQNDKLIIKYLNNEYGDLEEYKTDEYPDSVFYVKDNKVYMEYEKMILWVDYNTIWSDLKDIFNIEDSEVEHIITKWVEKTYNLEDVTPHIVSLRYKRWWKKLFN